MDTKPSEAVTDPSQVEAETPSEPEEGQVAAAEPSEEEKPAQEVEKPEPPSKEAIEAYLQSEEGQRIVQGVADKGILSLRREYDGKYAADREKERRDRELAEAKKTRDERIGIYRQLQALKAQKPEEWQRYMDDPQYAAIWAEGGRTAPSTEEIDNARQEGVRQLYGQIYQRRMACPELQNLTAEELALVDTQKFAGQPDAIPAFLDALDEVRINRRAATIAAKTVKEAEGAAYQRGRDDLQNEYREKGVPPPVIEGAPTGGALTPAKYAAMSTEDRQKLQRENPDAIDAMTKKAMGI